LTDPGDGTRRSGRRTGDSGTREAILSAARKRFGDHGYTGATIRAIAADAGVDPALVHHFFGTKERLFGAAMRLPLIPGEMIDAALAPGVRNPAQSLGEHLVRTVLGAWDVSEVRDMFLGLLRSAPAVGALSMSAFLAHRSLGHEVGAKLFGSVAVFGVSIVVFSLSRSLTLSLAALVVYGAMDAVSVVIRHSLVQTRTPADMLGRVIAVMPARAPAGPARLTDRGHGTGHSRP